MNNNNSNYDDNNKSYKHRKIEKCINNSGFPNYYDNNNNTTMK